MDIRNLQAFVRVAESGSFSLAAERLHLTQPAVSKRIAALESGLAHRLFDRMGRRLRLTEAGETLLPRARRILAEFEDARRRLEDLSGEVGGHLRLGTSHHIGLHRLPPLLRDFTRRYPEAQLDLEFLDSEAACEAVAQGRLDLGVVTLPTRPPDNLRVIPVWPDPLAFVVAPDHPLAVHRRVSPSRLAEHRAILPGPETYTGQIIARAFQARGVQLDAGPSIHYLETIKMLVAVGLGWSLLPRSLLDEQLIEVQVQGLGKLSRTLGLVRHRERTLSNAAQAFVDLLTPD
ncbi:LysR family transcriptional regulator [Thiohalobacter sp.]|uniref:LysR family transcriptional regulator n=1 Tax=Thiohalobacter sp. TaxID=2025948 RepID=UPI00261A3C1D|nr:LysR family transcriptional regulator [Thiohalobacter sp.]